jgi:SAM-dependent methyltransferase
MTPPAYGRLFAAYYNQHWQTFAEQTAPRLLAWYAATPPGRQRLPVLDLGCGTGQLTRHFLAAGYSVTGLDISADMLAHARANNALGVAEGRARFVQGDAAAFTLDGAFGLVVSTFDALNHLPDLEALRGCFRSARAVLAPGGRFVFDLNTRLGLQGWNSLTVHEHDGAG